MATTDDAPQTDPADSSPQVDEAQPQASPKQPDPAVAEATAGKGTDKSVLVDAVMTRFGMPSYDAWDMTIPDLIAKLEG